MWVNIIDSSGRPYGILHYIDLCFLCYLGQGILLCLSTQLRYVFPSKWMWKAHWGPQEGWTESGLIENLSEHWELWADGWMWLCFPVSFNLTPLASEVALELNEKPLYFAALWNGCSAESHKAEACHQCGHLNIFKTMHKSAAASNTAASKLDFLCSNTAASKPSDWFQLTKTDNCAWSEPVYFVLCSRHPLYCTRINP